MIEIITNESEIEQIHRRFQKKLSSEFTETFTCRIGYPGGSFDGIAKYSPRLDMWTAGQELDNRYWNAFGNGKPIDWNSNVITGEVNFPFDGINRRIGGVFAIEDNTKILVLHRGKIGGGKRGIGKTYFMDRYRDEPISVLDGNRVDRFCLVGELDSEYFITQLATFISEIRRVKDLNANTSRQHAPTIDNFEFTEETFGKTSISQSGTTTIDRVHGIVVNTLATVLEVKGYKVGNDRNRDLFIYNDGEITDLLEIKTSSNTQCIYSAVGQLIIYSIPIKNSPRLFAIFPMQVSDPIKSKMAELGIDIIYYKWVGQRLEFENLDVHFPLV